MGNASVSQKRYLIHFFDVVTGVCQVMIFFLLGLLVTPAELPAVFLPALCIMAFRTFIGRPAVVSAILLPFRSRPGADRHRLVGRPARRRLDRVRHLCRAGRRDHDLQPV